MHCASLLQPMMNLMRAMVYKGLSGVSDSCEDDQHVGGISDLT